MSSLYGALKRCLVATCKAWNMYKSNWQRDYAAWCRLPTTDMSGTYLSASRH